jgi:hypothetical protein
MADDFELTPTGRRVVRLRMYPAARRTRSASLLMTPSRSDTPQNRLEVTF